MITRNRARRILAILLAAVLAVCLLPAGALAEEQKGSILQVGYGKRDITPKAAVALAGYGSDLSRVTVVDEKGVPLRMDDNGDGVVDGKDGLFATCIAFRDETGQLMLWFAFDGDKPDDKLVTKLQYRIQEKWGLPPQYTLLNADHIHSGPSLGTWFSYVSVSNKPLPDRPGYDDDTRGAGYDKLSDREKTLVDAMGAYLYETLLPGLMGAAEDAIADLAPAKMFTGRISAPNMNFIRHYYQKADSNDPADVHGDNTRGAADYVKAYAQSNDTLYFVRFDRQGKDSIAAVDWRSHAKLNSTGSSTFGKEHRNYVSSDFVNAFRYGLETAGFKTCYFQGTAGNVNTFSDLFINSKAPDYLADPANPTDKDTVQAYTYDGKTQASQIGALYGQKLARYALEGLTKHAEQVPTGQIAAQRTKVFFDYNDYEYWKLIGGNGQEGMLYELVPGEYDANGKQLCVYDYLKTYWIDGWHTTDRAETIRGYLNRYKLNQKYHLSAILNTMKLNMKLDPETGRYVSMNRQSNCDLYAYTIGKSFACVAAPFEIFDGPYTFRDEIFPTTFVLGYSNNDRGYLPTRDAYSFANGNGSYEACTCSYAPGTMEFIAEAHRTMLRGLDPSGLPALCPHCGTAVTWKPLTPASDMETGHYYLTGDTVGSIPQMNIRDDTTVCLHLNGHSLISTGTSTSRLFALLRTGSGAGAVLNIMGDGLLQTKGTKITLDPSGQAASSPYQNSGVIQCQAGTTVNIYGGTIRYQPAAGQWSQYGGVIGAFGTVNMYGGAVTMAEAPEGVDVLTRRGGLIYVEGAGEFNMTGGTVSGGRVAPNGQGDNIYAGGTVSISGDARVDGGIWIADEGKLILSGAPKLHRADGYDVYLSDGPGSIDATGLTGGGRIGVSAQSVPRELGKAAASPGRTIISEDVERYVQYDKSGNISLEEGRRYCPCRGALEGVPGHTCRYDQTWEAWRNPAALPTSGYYYLEKDVVLPSSVAVKGAAGIDLNGHTVTAAGAPAFTLDGGELAMTDSAGGGSVRAADGLAQVTKDAALALASIDVQGDVTAQADAALALAVGEAKLTGAVNGEKIALDLSRDGALALTADSAVGSYEGSALSIRRNGHVITVAGSELAALPFTDVAESDGFFDAVAWVYTNGIMSGYGPTTFGPDNTLTRAMVVQVLYNKEQKPAVEADNPFKDIASGQWYYDAVRWGAAKNVVAGYGGGVFKPDDNVTVEQVAVILHNYSGKPASNGDAANLGAHSDWAEPALAWAAEQGLFAGMSGVRVTAPATRAQTAQMLMNYLK